MYINIINKNVKNTTRSWANTETSHGAKIRLKSKRIFDAPSAEVSARNSCFSIFLRFLYLN